MRRKRAFYNFLTSFALQIVVLICGLIIPRLILSRFGSSVNGLVTSISQFLGYIALLEAGVGGVVRASLYKPLSKGDYSTVSRILKSTEYYFRKLALFFIIFLLVLSVTFPLIVRKDFEFWYTSLLVIIIGISTFCEYYFGITYQILLQADQKRYYIHLIQIITYIINLIIVIILIQLNFGIHIIKLISSLIFITRPIIINIIIKKKYRLIKDCEPDYETIKQRWDGFAHHVAFFLHTHTDVVVLTIFSSIKLVSVYSVYYMIVSNIQKLIFTFVSGIEATFGDMLAKNEITSLKIYFRLYEFMIFIITFILFTSTAILIIPFMSIYTRGITEIDYIRPIFAYVLIASEAIYCLRIPYHTVTVAAGHFKQTRKGAFVEVIINVLLSVILVFYFDLVGVVIGTLIAMLFRTAYYVNYLSKNILHLNILDFIKRLVINITCTLSVILISTFLPKWDINTYNMWIIYAIIITTISSFLFIIINSLFYKKDMKAFITIILDIFHQKRKTPDNI